jgi:DNA polymerase-3 subunit epsilon
MKRLLALDVETTGIEPEDGHRIIEIACVEIVDSKTAIRSMYHTYIYPNRLVGNSEKIHGITDDFLQDKPQFSAIAKEFLSYIEGATLVIHNAEFDLGFLNNELQIMGISESIEDKCTIIDSLEMCKEKYPTKEQYNLDSLCQYFNIGHDNALFDAQIVAQVYLSIMADDKNT